MAGLTPLPTHHLHSSTRLTHREAHTFLSSFLERADIDAAYRPDSTLTERGPQAVSTGSSPNLTLHHLKRILLGMEGKRVASAAVETETEGAEDEKANADNNNATSTTTTTTTTTSRNKRSLDDNHQESQTPKKSKRKIYDAAAADNTANAIVDDSDGPAVAAAAAISDAEGWQDKDTFALAQMEENLEATAGDRHPGADLEQPADEADEEQMMHVEVEGAGKKLSSKDKEERKRLKKLRNKEEKAKKAEEAKRKSKK